MNVLQHFSSHNFIKAILAAFLIISTTVSYAAPSYHGDSVMSATGVYSTAPVILSGQSVTTGKSYSSTQVVEYQTGVCPAGLTTASGSSTYNSAQRTITTTYLGSQMVGTTTSGWADTDTDCIGYQYQTLACPTDYTGSISQQQKISTGTGGLVYGGWTTTANSCVYNPPVCSNGGTNYPTCTPPVTPATVKSSTARCGGTYGAGTPQYNVVFNSAVSDASYSAWAPSGYAVCTALGGTGTRTGALCYDSTSSYNSWMASAAAGQTLKYQACR